MADLIFLAGVFTLLFAPTASAEDNIRFISAEVKIIFIPAEGIEHEKIEYTSSYTGDVSKTDNVILPPELTRRGWKCARSSYHDEAINFGCTHEKNLFVFADSSLTKITPQLAFTQGMFTESFADGLAVIMFGTSVSKHPTGIKGETRVVIPTKVK